MYICYRKNPALVRRAEMVAWLTEITGERRETIVEKIRAGEADRSIEFSGIVFYSEDRVIVVMMGYASRKKVYWAMIGGSK